MTRLSRYFLKEFLQPLAFSLGILAVLILVSELLEHLDKFMAGNAGAAVVAEYLLCLLPMRFGEIMPMAILLATLLALGNLSHRREITAAMAGGIHPWTSVKPLLVSGVVLSVLSWALSEWVVPPTYRHAQALYQIDIRHFAFAKPGKIDNVTAAGRDGVFYAIGLLDTERKAMEDVVVEFTSASGLASQIEAPAASYEGNRWVFKGGVERRYGGNGLDLVSQSSFSAKTVELRESPMDLVPHEQDAQEMSYAGYKEQISKTRRLGFSTRRQEVELHLKLAYPWANLIVLLLGIPFAFQKSGGKVKAVGYALGVAFIYFGLLQVGRALGQREWCPPLAAAWLANVVFLSIGMHLFRRMRRLS